MRIVRKLVVGVALVFLSCGAFSLMTGPQAAPPARSGKRVVVDCRPGWRGSAVGAYGGVSFGVSCNNGRGQTTLIGTVGEAYSVRMGAEGPTVAVDCFFTGDAPTVNETCGEVRLSIR